MESEIQPLNPLKNKRYKTCFMPLCENNTTKNPNKLFFHVPTNDNMKNKWFEAAHRDIQCSPKTVLYCCEDHFDLQFDMENIVRFQLYCGNCTLKAGVIPHKFQCQSNRILISQDLNRSAFKKLNRKREVHEILHSSKRSCLPSKENIYLPRAECIDQSELTNQPSTSGCSLFSNTEKSQHTLSATRNSISESAMETTEAPRSFGEGTLSMEYAQTSKVTFGTQTNIKNLKPYYRSETVMCKPQMKDESCNVQPETVDAACSPISSLDIPVVALSQSTIHSKSTTDLSSKMKIKEAVINHIYQIQKTVFQVSRKIKNIKKKYNKHL